MNIEKIISELLNSNEYKEIEYKCLTIRKDTYFYLYYSPNQNKELEKWMQPFFKLILDKIEKENTDYNSLIYYMLDRDRTQGITYLIFTLLNKNMIINIQKLANNIAARCNLVDLLVDVDKNDIAFMLLIYILDNILSENKDFDWILKNEKFIYERNSYNLTKINGCCFKKDGVLFDGKVYLYNLFLDKICINQFDSMPGFAKIITEEVKDGDILYRIDENLAIPEEYYHNYTGVKFAKYRGPNFDFKKEGLQDLKTITVHINEKTLDKLMLVIKTAYDEKTKEEFWHVEIETLPYIKNNIKYVYTSFLHGMYFPKKNKFTHIDLAKNRYSYDIYVEKYNDANGNIKIDQYTNNKNEHYKLWCIENGEYSIMTWKKLILASLNEEYAELFREIVE